MRSACASQKRAPMAAQCGRIGSVIDKGLKVPTDADGSSGVKSMWFRGEITVTLYFCGFSRLNKLKQPQPDPRIVSRVRPFCAIGRARRRSQRGLRRPRPEQPRAPP
mmetsp:Transcript_80068/g.226990  ORF Transcript_80068/g.226990 Transcript_80068/m.226990 type:complete len:107 (-) Transcript_80068:7-327(-)